MTFTLLLLLAFAPVGELRITAGQAKDHIGEQATVCGQVITATFARRSHNTPTMLNLDSRLIIG